LAGGGILRFFMILDPLFERKVRAAKNGPTTSASSKRTQPGRGRNPPEEIQRRTENRRKKTAGRKP
jgi:hypothetical protein